METMACPRLLPPSIVVALVFASSGVFAAMPEPPRRPPELNADRENRQAPPAGPSIPTIDPACAAVLADPGIDASAGEAMSAAGGCGMANPVTLRRVMVGGRRWVTFEAPPMVNCAAAAALAAWAFRKARRDRSMALSL